MHNTNIRRKAKEPEDLARLFLEYANRGDVEGLVALYEPEAVLALSDGHVAIGSGEIRKFYSAHGKAGPNSMPDLATLNEFRCEAALA